MLVHLLPSDIPLTYTLVEHPHKHILLRIHPQTLLISLQSLLKKPAILVNA